MTPDLEAFTAAYMEACKGKPSDHNEIGLHYARSLWDAAIKHEREACAVICDELQEHYAGYKDTALLNGDVELSNASSGEPRACIAIAAAIRSRNAP